MNGFAKFLKVVHFLLRWPARIFLGVCGILGIITSGGSMLLGFIIVYPIELLILWLLAKLVKIWIGHLSQEVLDEMN